MNELEKVVAGGAIAAMPAHLEGKELGTEALSNVIVPSYIKVVQKMADDALLEKFKPGDVILSPELTPLHIMGSGQPVVFIPVFFYEEWVTRNPRRSKIKLPFIRAKSLDPKSDIAIKAGSPDTWAEPCPEDESEEIQHVHCLNYLVMLRGPNAPLLPSIMSFQVMEQKTGRAFANLIAMRRAPIYGCAFEFTSSTGAKRQNEAGSWYGLDIENADEPWVTPEESEVYEKLHLDLKAKFAAGEIQANYDEDSRNANAASGADAATAEAKGF